MGCEAILTWPETYGKRKKRTRRTRCACADKPHYKHMRRKELALLSLKAASAALLSSKPPYGDETMAIKLSMVSTATE